MAAELWLIAGAFLILQQLAGKCLLQLLILQTGLLGVFLAVDIFLFYIFWELVLIPAYFIDYFGAEFPRVKACFAVFYLYYGSFFFNAACYFGFGNSLFSTNIVLVLSAFDK